MIRHYNITVKGKVQRVSYRFCTHAQAIKCNLTGYVRNLHSGDVLIEAEGLEEERTARRSHHQRADRRGQVEARPGR